jgi:5'-deoxynucleotidase YfbR-like HD superfamily hydrolase
MKKIIDIYKEYEIMPSLQQHMLRVAAAAYLICDNFDVNLPKNEIITACLFHDMGNIIKSDLKKFPDFLEPEGLSYWAQVKNKYIEKYGNEEHFATEVIAKEMDLPLKIVDIIKQIGFSNATKNELEKIFEYKICNYSDLRVGPYGVLSLNERTKEAHERYKDRKHSLSSDSFESLSSSLKNVEKQIFERCKIKPEDINDESIAPIVLELKNFVIE